MEGEIKPGLLPSFSSSVNSVAFQNCRLSRQAQAGHELLLVLPESSGKVWDPARLYLGHILLRVFGFNLTFLFVKSHPFFSYLRSSTHFFFFTLVSGDKIIFHLLRSLTHAWSFELG